MNLLQKWFASISHETCLRKHIYEAKTTCDPIYKTFIEIHNKYCFYKCILFLHFCSVTHFMYSGNMVSHVALVLELVLTKITGKLFLGMHITYVPLQV